MKGLTITAMLLVALTTAAAAKPTPDSDFNRTDDRVPVLASNAAPIAIEPAGATRERGYFQAQPEQFNAGRLYCHIRLNIFDKTRLAQSCN